MTTVMMMLVRRTARQLIELKRDGLQQTGLDPKTPQDARSIRPRAGGRSWKHAMLCKILSTEVFRIQNTNCNLYFKYKIRVTNLAFIISQCYQVFKSNRVILLRNLLYAVPSCTICQFWLFAGQC